MKWSEHMEKLKANKWLGAILLIVMIIVFGPELTAFGAEYSQTIRLVRPLEAEEAEGFTEPPWEYEDENGAVYDLENWKLDRLPGSRVSQEASRQVVYRAVEGAQSVPSTITVREQRTDGSQDSGPQASGPQNSGPQDSGPQEVCGTLSATETRILGETWSNDFQVPMVFHSYGAQVYELGDVSISAEDGFPPPEEYQDELLEILKLPRDGYEITQLSWNGEPYAGPDGELCREAMASGRKRLVDYQVTYEGRVSWQMPETCRLETVYRLRPPVVEAEGSALSETLAAETPSPEPETPELWYWVRSGFVITVAAGLAGIAVGILILLVMWLKREQNVKQHLSKIKG